MKVFLPGKAFLIEFQACNSVIFTPYTPLGFRYQMANTLKKIQDGMVRQEKIWPDSVLPESAIE
jgi:hypothetical protein